jgi:hypothetical protein
VTVLLCIASAIAASGITLARVSASMTRLREQMTKEIQYWRTEATNARMDAAQAARDATTWAAGHAQGRDDAIRIMPLIAAAREQAAEPDRGADELTDQT